MKSKPYPNQNYKPNKKTYLIVGLVVLVIAAIVFGTFLLTPEKKAFAGKAVQSVGGPSGPTVEASWGFSKTSITGGTFTQLYNGEYIDVPVFVNFGSVGKKLFVVRFEVAYNPNVLQPEGVTSFLGAAYTPLPTDTGGLRDTIYRIENNKLIIETFTSSSNADEITHTGQKDVFTIRFKIIASEPGQQKTEEYTSAITLLPLVDSGNSVTDNGFWGEQVAEKEVQLATPSPDPSSVTLHVRPPCYDSDRDKYGQPSTDQSSCDNAGNDCNDADSAINPGAKEICNAADDNCDGQINEGLENNLGFNDPPVAGTPLKGICLGYKECVNGALKNSYDEFASADDLYSPAELCDHYDNNCDGTINEGLEATCQLGAAAALLHKAGDVFFRTFKADDTIDTERTLVDVDDLFGSFILKLTTGRATPYCLPFEIDIGYLCYCPSGDYYKYKPDPNNPTGNVVGYYSVDYKQGKRTIKAGYKVITINNELTLVDTNNNPVLCQVS